MCHYFKINFLKASKQQKSKKMFRIFFVAIKRERKQLRKIPNTFFMAEQKSKKHCRTWNSV